MTCPCVQGFGGPTSPDSAGASVPPQSGYAETTIARLVPLDRCGPIALQVCARRLGKTLSNDDVERQIKDSGMTSFATLVDAAEGLGLVAAPVRLKGVLPRCLRYPAILAVKKEGVPHFIVAIRSDSKANVIVDFPHTYVATESQLREKADRDGECLYITDARLSRFWIYLVCARKRIWTFLATILAFSIVSWAFLKARSTGRERFAKTITNGVLLLTVIGCDSPNVSIEPRTITVRLADADLDRHFEASVRLTNNSSESVQLISATPSCACATIDVSGDSRLSASENIAIPFRFQVPSHGTRTGSIAIALTSQGRQWIEVVRFSLIGNPLEVPFMAQSPSEVVFRDKRGTIEPVSFSLVTVEARNTEPWVSEITCSDAAVHISPIEMTEDDFNAEHVQRVYHVQLVAPPNGMPQALPQLNVAAAGAAIASIPVRLVEWNPVAVHPKALFLDASKEVGSSFAQRELRLESLESDFVIAHVAITSELPQGVSSDVSVADACATVTMKFDLTASHDQDIDRTRLVLDVTSDSELRYEIEVPLVVRHGP